MNGLVNELQAYATDPSVSIADLLRKAKIVAVKLRQKETAAWIDAELSGDFEAIPAYRFIVVQLMAQFPYTQGLQPVREPLWLLEIANKPHPIRHAIREVEEIAAAAAASGEAYLSLPDSIIQSLVEMGSPTRELWLRTTPSAFEGLLDAVKTRVLDWALALEEQGVQGEGMSFSPEEQQRAAPVTIHLNGNIENFAGVMGSGVANVTQTINYASAHAAADALRESVGENPNAAEFVKNAADEIDAAAKANEPTRLKRALTSAKKMLPMLVSWATRTVAEHELDSALDLLG